MTSNGKTLRARLSQSFNTLSGLILRDPYILRNFLKPIAVRIVRLFTLSRGFSLNIAGKYNVRFCETFFFSNWENFGTGHNSGFRFVMSRLQEDSVFYDIGAHIGLFSIPVAKSFNGVKVVAFEPSSINNKFLNKHIRLNRLANVQQVNCLVGEKCSKAEFYEDFENVNAMGSTIPSLYGANSFSRTHKDVICVDDFVDEGGPIPTIMKIDVEGAELDVLRGAQNVLEMHNPILVVSLHPRILRSFNVEPAEVVQFIESLGYRCFEDDGRTAYRYGSNELICEKINA